MKTKLRWLLSAFMVIMGVLHFAVPGEFVRMIPPSLSGPLALVYVSGVAELMGGIGLQIERVQKWAAWGLIVLYVAVFPANVYMAMHQQSYAGMGSPAALWGRLPFQALFIAWAYWYTRP
jgi:uncharacterized membrane protein